MDLLPTFAKLAGAELPSDRVIDGKDIWPVQAGNGKSPHEAFFCHKGKPILKIPNAERWRFATASNLERRGFPIGTLPYTVRPSTK